MHAFVCQWICRLVGIFACNLPLLSPSPPLPPSPSPPLPLSPSPPLPLSPLSPSLPLTLPLLCLCLSPAPLPLPLPPLSSFRWCMPSCWCCFAGCKRNASWVLASFISILLRRLRVATRRSRRRLPPQAFGTFGPAGGRFFFVFFFAGFVSEGCPQVFRLQTQHQPGFLRPAVDVLSFLSFHAAILLRASRRSRPLRQASRATFTPQYCGTRRKHQPRLVQFVWTLHEVIFVSDSVNPDQSANPCRAARA